MRPLPFAFKKAAASAVVAAWYDVATQAQSDGTRIADSVGIVQSAIVLPAGTVTKLRAYCSTVPTYTSLLMRLYTSGGVYLGQGSELIETPDAAGTYEVLLDAPIVIAAGTYRIAGLASSASNVVFGTSTLASPLRFDIHNGATPADSWAASYSNDTTRGLCFGAYVDTAAAVPAWCYSLRSELVTTDISLTTNVLRNALITLPAGNMTKFAVWKRTHTTGRDVRMGIYNAARTFSIQATITCTATGWNEVSITPTAVAAGHYFAAINATVDGDMGGYTILSAGVRHSKNATYTTFPDPLPANDAGPTTGGFATRVYVE